ncbi:hypothetical protein [Microbacterium sp. BR1]|uniref:hypothetical protein n=1 Tax=Microbacterium sp. BR1 TaxID=1070896 RepID=UPI0012FDEB4E|nr:hypothetical protein [Microbacterium sp. BR1]
MSRIYATPGDYDTFAEEPFEGTATLLTKRLRAASIEVEKITRRAWYDTDTDGYPTDTDISAAFTEATCAIVEYWVETDDPMGVETLEGAVKIGSVSLGTTSSSATVLSEGEKLARRIGSRALDILANAGLINSAVSHS